MLAQEEAAGHGEEQPRGSLSSRVERLPKGESVAFAFQNWMGEGYAVDRGEIFHAINRLRKRKMNRRALEVSWFVPSIICLVQEQPSLERDLLMIRTLSMLYDID